MTLYLDSTVSEYRSVFNLNYLLSKTLLAVTSYTLVPVQLGSGCAGLHHKTSSFAYQLYLQALSVANLLGCLASVRCVTSDLGVEAGIVDWQAPTLKSMLPAWLDLLDLQNDVQGDMPDPQVAPGDGPEHADANAEIQLPGDVEGDDDDDSDPLVLGIQGDCDGGVGLLAPDIPDDSEYDYCALAPDIPCDSAHDSGVEAPDIPCDMNVEEGGPDHADINGAERGPDQQDHGVDRGKSLSAARRSRTLTPRPTHPKVSIIHL